MLLNILSCRSITSSIHKFKIVYQSVARNTKYRYSAFCGSFHSSSKYTCKIKNARKYNSQDIFCQINTNVKNNVILYKHPRNKDATLLKIMFFGWLVGVTTMIINTYDRKYFIWPTNQSWKEYLTNNGVNFICFVLGIIIGPIACSLVYYINQRMVKYIILHKGGNTLSIVTNRIYGGVNSFTLPVKSVKMARYAKENTINYITVEIKKSKFNYVLDANGKFVNKQLFDYVIGSVKPL